MRADVWPLDAATHIVRPQGDLDMAAAPGFRLSLVEALDSGAARVVVDLAEVTFIDSTGLGVLVGAVKRARAGGVELVVASAPSSIRKVFEITGIDDIVELGERS